MEIKAIETTYKGYKFRSRIEARWAVVFDTLGIPWEYEKEGYDLPSGAYLADFWLPTAEHPFGKGVWFEVKGEAPKQIEKQLAAELATATGHAVVMAHGEIPVVDEPVFVAGEHMSIFYGTDGKTLSMDYPMTIAYCDDCSEFAFVFLGYWDRMCSHFEDNGGYYALPSKKLRKAYRSGRAARFEHKKRLFA